MLGVTQAEDGVQQQRPQAGQEDQDDGRTQNEENGSHGPVSRRMPAESVKQPGADGRYISQMGQRWSNRGPLVSVERLIIVG
jgi:hypothetical protein